ncbi:hypothetical protein MCOR27_010512 [Pyricularia oryzae]|nr:hypothetical protein MCOR19_010596 [Pyricularia oryzae]KAI6265238.1 hypothetical protein MCOR26_010850 [Pyricularia oryzae]KAI6267600.1 hypothetical protein MCOR27_010512 [Pyricularia oryzae]KAI6342682.1 hypothetical protein MCOR28_005289 [Pyricularia oryzae]KAI6353063.1 hypothetical protein MCOR32_010996 [Pyricularia oryzae]
MKDMLSVKNENFMPFEEVLPGLLAAGFEGDGKFELRQTSEQMYGPDLDDDIKATPKTRTKVFGDPVQVRGFNRDIRAIMSKPLSSDELRAAAAGGGYVYVFCLPLHEAVSPPTRHVKIGMTTRSVPDRMRRIASACRYEPSVVCSAFTRYPLRVERLCHAQLRGQRRRESPGCPGCGRAHREWFEVSQPEAERVMCFWSEWIEHAEPYNKDTGELKSEWSVRLGEVQVDDEPGRCWGIFLS